MTLQRAWNKTKNQLRRIMPKVILIVIVINIIKTLLMQYKINLSTNNIFVDSLIGSTIGSLLAGNPINGYIIANGFIGHSSYAFIISFLISWVLVGMAQLPLEIELFGKNFAITRNIIGFLLSVLAGIMYSLFIQWI